MNFIKINIILKTSMKNAIIIITLMNQIFIIALINLNALIIIANLYQIKINVSITVKMMIFIHMNTMIFVI